MLLVPLFSGEGTVPACFALPPANRLSMFLHLETQVREEKRRALVFGVQQGQRAIAAGYTWRPYQFFRLRFAFSIKSALYSESTRNLISTVVQDPATWRPL